MKVIMVMMRMIMMMIKLCNLSTHISLFDCPIQLAIFIGPKSDHCLAFSTHLPNALTEITLADNDGY